MTKKDFFVVIIRVFALYSLSYTIFYTINTIANLSHLIYEYNEEYSLILLLLGSIAVNFFLFYLLVSKSERIVVFLNLLKGFDDQRIEFGNLNDSGLLKIGVFIIGGLTVISNIPGLIKSIINLFKDYGEGEVLEFSRKEKYDWIINSAKVTIGFLLLIYYDRIATFFKTNKRI